MAKIQGFAISEGTLRGLYLVNKYRFLTISQFAKIANFSNYHAAEVLRRLEARNAVGYFGYVAIPGHGRTPKVYFLKRKGWEYLRTETDYDEEEIGHFQEVHMELAWTPQMYHRLRLLDLFISLETQVQTRPHLALVRTFIEYRRLKGTYLRETADFVSGEHMSGNRIVPDGAFVLENRETGRRGLFLLEMDMGTERITVKRSRDQRATVKGKFEQYDRYLQSGRFASFYQDYGQFRGFTLLFVTYGAERVENIRAAVSSLAPQLHSYYRLTTFEACITDFLGMIWKSRARTDKVIYALIAQSAENL